MPSEKLIRPVMPELDSLRGLAILGVLFLHAFFWPYSGLHFTGWSRLLLATKPGWMGVNLFLALRVFDNRDFARFRNQPRYYSRFYTRRNAGSAAVGLAYLSRRYFEEAFLRLKDRFTRDDAPALAPEAAPALPQFQDPG